MEQIFNTLTELIKSHEKIVIMTHKNADFDGMSCAIALQQVIKSFDKDSYICVNNKEDKMLLKAYQYLNEKKLYHSTFNNKEAIKYTDNNTLLIILDVYKSSILEEPSLLDKTDKVVIIDHHIKGQEYIKKSILTYVNANLSSTVEFIAEYIKYLNKVVDPIIATFMLIGIEIDTNNFKLKTSEKTFETAAYLSKIGANNIVKRELLQESKEIYLQKQNLIKSSFMINETMAMCLADNEIYDKGALASIAEELLQFENVQASFVIGKIENKTIGISARSIGKIDVERIMAKLGGGGHINEAATQIKNKTILQVKEMIIKEIE